MECAYRNVSYFFVAILAIIIVGFYPHYFVHFADFAGFTYVHHTHTVLLLLWFAMLIVQPILIYQQRLDLHCLLGKTSYVLMPLIVGSMLAAIKTGYVKSLLRLPQAQNLASLYLPISALIPFGTLYILAIVYRKRPALLMRYMIALAVALLGPGVGRIPLDITDFNTAIMVAFALCDVWLLGLLLQEYTKGKVYQPYLLSLFGVLCANGRIYTVSN